MHTIHDLRKNGYKVRVLHFNVGADPMLGGFGHVCKYNYRIRFANDGHPNVTQIDVTTPDGRDATGYAFRAMGDPFDRKRGNLIALNRAMNQLV